jgi:hypothetical protein
MEQDTGDPDAPSSPVDIQMAAASDKDEVPSDPLSAPYFQFHRLWMSWVLGDPEIRTDWHRAGQAGWVLAAWNVPAWSVLFIGMWVKDTYDVEDPLGIAGAIVAAALFALVWFGGARLTLRWLRHHRG